MVQESIKEIEYNYDLESQKLAETQEQNFLIKQEFYNFQSSIDIKKYEFKNYEPRKINPGESIFSIVQKEGLMELAGRNIYQICEDIKKYNIQNQIFDESTYNYDNQKNPIVSENTDIKEPLSTGFIYLPLVDHLKLSDAEIQTKNAYEKLFEGKDDLNISKNLKRGSIKLGNLEDINPYIEDYYNKLLKDGYVVSYDEVLAEFKAYNKSTSEKAKKIGIKNYYDGSDTFVEGSMVYVPLYKHITEKTIINNFPEKEKYSELNAKELTALEDIVKKSNLDKEKGKDKFNTDTHYAILVNTSQKGKHQVILCDTEKMCVVRRYICSTGNEPGGIYTPRGIFRIDDRKKGEGREMQTYRDGILQNNGNGAIMPRACDMNGNFSSSAWHGTGATMTARLMPLNISADIYFHGTNDVKNLGNFASHGCIRMLSGDVMELFDLVPPGTYVNVMDPYIYKNH